MSANAQSRPSSYLGLALIALVLVVSIQPRAHSNFPAAVDEVRWQYSATTVDASELQAKVLAVGNDGSEIVSVIRSESYVDQAPDGKAHLYTAKYDIISRKKMAD